MAAAVPDYAGHHGPQLSRHHVQPPLGPGPVRELPHEGQSLLRGVTEAYTETDKAKSLTAWQKIFGADFKAPVTASATAASVQVARPKVAPAPREQFIEQKSLLRAARYRAQINATVLLRAGFRGGPLRVFRKVGKGRELKFTISTDVPEPFDLCWKVRNNGPEAERAGGLRGELLLDEKRTRARNENTLYRGRHYIECYIVKDRRLVASDRHDVVIE